ncbi:hypothetical protein ACHHYP_17274 [Achlya hypogyna]|uniref:Transmembrane protein n=1 Tax=Achlya hypogyna TaxID=1202772 RepID=A0A1V9Y4T7_ACHHY|nr:hypothetical protein ACHHYP_17274 [Achlya hypogyna]
MWVQLVIGSILAASSVFSAQAITKAQSRPPVAETFQYTTHATYYVHLVFRIAVVVLYSAVFVVEAGDLGLKMLSYYTVWNFVLQMVYYLWAIKYQILTSASRDGPVVVSREGSRLNSLFDICFANSILVIAIYWGFLYNPKMLWYSCIQHGGNTLIFLLEFSGNQFLVQSTNVVYVAVFPTVYAVFIWISNATWLNGWWPYSFLTMETPVAPLWYIGVFVGHFLLFGLALGISYLKARFLPSMCPAVLANKIFINSINYDSIATPGPMLYAEYSSEAHAKGLFVFRSIVVALYIATIIYQVVYIEGRAYTMYTVWNFTLQLIYFAWSLKVQMTEWGQRIVAVSAERRHLNTLFTVVFATSFLVALVYWSVIYKSATWWVGYMEHAGNNVLLIIDFCLNHHFAERAHAPFAALWPVVYVTIIWICKATFLDKWPYTFMNQEKAIAPVMYIGVILAHCFCFGFALLLAKAKARWLPARRLLSEPAKDDITYSHVQSAKEELSCHV